MSRQCPRCGAFDDESPFVGSLCRECHVELNMPTLPRKITIYTCRDCGTEKFKGWLDQDIPAEIAYSLKSKIFGIPKIRVLDDCIEVAYKGIPELFTVPLVRKESMCDTCTRRHSGYYEGIVQVRGLYARDDKFRESLLSKLGKATFITKIVELKEGIDIYTGDKMLTRSVLSSLKLKPKLSHTLYGVKDGQRVYRTTFLIRK